MFFSSRLLTPPPRRPVWALAYNVLGVPTAAGLVMPLVHGFHMRPEVAAACMATSSNPNPNPNPTLTQP